MLVPLTVESFSSNIKSNIICNIAPNVSSRASIIISDSIFSVLLFLLYWIELQQKETIN